MKRIIFDLDNTILDTYQDGFNSFKNYIKDKNIINLDPIDLYKTIGDYESVGSFLDYENLANYLTKHLGMKFTKNDLLEMFSYYELESTLIDDSTYEVLDYLSSKYELIILTNWYLDQQTKRLKKIGLDKYFKEIYALENCGKKPDVEVFKKACYPHKFDECMIIGDSLESDIIVPNELGMKALYFNPLKKDTNYEYITNIKELERRL